MSGSHVSESRKQECKSASTDVVFLLDSSGSVGSENFKKILNFTKAIVSRFTVGPHNTLVGIETFASTVHHQFALDANKNMATLLTAVDNVPYQTGGTNIEAALKYVNDYSFKPGGRRNAEKILILITDGQTYSPNGTAIQAKSLRKTNIKVFCIGIGHSINSKELQHISSGADHTFLIEDFNSLTTAIKVMHSVICKANSRITTAKQSRTEERKRNVTAKATTKLKTTMQVSKNIKAPVYLRDVIHGFEYLEVTVLSIVSVIAMGAFGCCCRFCFIFAKRKETEEEEKPKRKPPCKRPKGWPSY
ncbi:collagen alpha-1(XII) chain-like [Saccostrea cucullata]|uniref:collagen alpha-1(XII) chain-like n=1 Tax=Saccostrea cuccullata TaxID=36930 RepID=UPI002ED4643D